MIRFNSVHLNCRSISFPFTITYHIRHVFQVQPQPLEGFKKGLFLIRLHGKCMERFSLHSVYPSRIDVLRKIIANRVVFTSKVEM